MLPLMLVLSSVMTANAAGTEAARIVVSLSAHDAAPPTITVAGVVNVRAYERRDERSRKVSTEVVLRSGERIAMVTREPAAPSSNWPDPVHIEAENNASTTPVEIRPTNGAGDAAGAGAQEAAPAPSTLEWRASDGTLTTITGYGLASIELESAPEDPASTGSGSGAESIVRPVFSLSPVGPNPSQGSMIMRFQLPAAGHANLTLYDVAGRRIATLLDEDRIAGAHSVQHQAMTRLARGYYYLRLTFTEPGGRPRTATQTVVRLR